MNNIPADVLAAQGGNFVIAVSVTAMIGEQAALARIPHIKQLQARLDPELFRLSPRGTQSTSNVGMRCFVSLVASSSL